MSCPLVTFAPVQVFLVEYEVHLQYQQYWHRSTIPYHDAFPPQFPMTWSPLYPSIYERTDAFIATVSLITHPMEENIISKPKSVLRHRDLQREGGNVDHGFNFASVDKQIKRADKIYAHEVSHYRRSQGDNAVMCQNHHSPAVDTLGLRMY
ncbi:hypothetical protein FOXYS1_11168 [Fusarium oxysporum]|uniref:Uncharacterized protein n=1 Tax=Fusarium oxysporum TaxID=5507 RepID=A0A8H5A488_FUSOX|nr:hypothetical protein FOXYS1_11168 [Fusarium oxysporum]